MAHTSPINVEDYRQLAKKRLPRMVFDYLDGGAEDEKGLKHNRTVFDNVRLKPQRLVDVNQRSLSTELFGSPLSMPLIIAPTGLNGVLWPKGDIALARSAAKAGIPFVLSTASNSSIEEVASECDGELWFQLYVVHRTLAESMVTRALKAGYTTLVLTTDVSVNGYRERDIRNGFKIPFNYTPRVLLDGMRHPRWSFDALKHGMPSLKNFETSAAQDIEVQAALMSRQMDASFDWEALKRLRDIWPHRLIVKGLTDVRDAHKCYQLGIDGVILSNHGGRQLDTCVSPLESLVEVTEACPFPVLIDSGFRRGSDVVKALAMGASAVLLGRAALYGLSAAGEAGVDDVLRLLKEDIDRTMAQVGCASIHQLTKDFIKCDNAGLSPALHKTGA